MNKAVLVEAVIDERGRVYIKHDCGNGWVKYDPVSVTHYPHPGVDVQEGGRPDSVNETVLVEGFRLQEGRGLPAQWLDKVEFRSSDGHRVHTERVLVGTHLVHPHPGVPIAELVAAVREYGRATAQIVSGEPPPTAVLERIHAAEGNLCDLYARMDDEGVRSHEEVELRGTNR